MDNSLCKAHYFSAITVFLHEKKSTHIKQNKKLILGTFFPAKFLADTNYDLF